VLPEKGSQLTQDQPRIIVFGILGSPRRRDFPTLARALAKSKHNAMRLFLKEQRAEVRCSLEFCLLRDKR
jgi:hypothetical protein